MTTKEQIIELIEKDIYRTEQALLRGTFINPFNGMKIEEVTEEKRKFAPLIVKYLREFLIPEIKKLPV